MHPDQAVDAIIDAALYQNISFFVVPCCVFSCEFPNRRIPIITTTTTTTNSNGDNNNDDDDNGRKNTIVTTPTGTMQTGIPPTSTNTTTKTTTKTTRTKLVTTYDELLQYLENKSPDIQRHVLPFEGRNVCLYRVVVDSQSR